MRYKLLSSGDKATYALIFESGDEVVETMKTFAREHKLKASSFKAVGAFNEAMLGFFDFSIRDYKKIPVNEQVEVLSLIGDVALYGDEPQAHMHVVLGRENGNVIGGHLLQAKVHPTLEVILEESSSYLQKRIDKETGLPLIVID
jgi:predicted DNA-binding protein with PD1-like motif